MLLRGSSHDRRAEVAEMWQVKHTRRFKTDPANRDWGSRMQVCLGMNANVAHSLKKVGGKRLDT